VTDKEWIQSELKRLSIPASIASTRAGLSNAFIRMFLTKDYPLSDKARKALTAMFAAESARMAMDATTLRAALLKTGISARDIARGARIHAQSVDRFLTEQVILHPNTIERLRIWLGKGAHVPMGLHCKYKDGKPCGEAFVRRMLGASLVFVDKNGREYGRVQGLGAYGRSGQLACHTEADPAVFHDGNGRYVQR